ncbi:MAG TPA: outer membrane lipoprotein chaperone LolA [Xanthomonadaceae bacterium]|nr:outer membrane lipoprotein chaperone LolA [Xanthomonadaceae bacterium]
MQLKRSLILAAALAFTGLALAGTAQAAARDDLDAFTRGLKGLQGTFSQQVFDPKGNRKESTSGRVALSAPRLFRWEYAEPYPQLIVADGKHVWVYEPDLQQATKRPQGTEEQNSPLAALVEPARLERDFNLVEAGTRDGLDWLELTPRRGDEGGFRSARLGFDDDGLRKMTVVDALGQRTEIEFSGWKRNPDFAKGTFNFVPAEGVDVVGQG